MTGPLHRLRESADALSERNFRLLWLGQTGSTFGDGLTFVAIAFAVIGLGGSATDLGLVFAAYSLPNVVFLLAGGVWADRLPRNLVMLTSDGIRAVVQTGFAYLLFSGSAEIWHLIVVAALHGTSSAFFVPAATGLMPQVVSQPRLQQANALMAISRSLAFIIGPAVSGIIVATFGPGWVFAIDAATYVLSLVTLAALQIDRQAAVAERASFLSELAHGWREVRSRDWLIASLLAFSLSNIGLGAFMVLGPLIIDRELGGAADWGLILTVGSLGALLGGAVALRWKPGRPLLVGFLVMLVGVTRTLSLIPPLPVLVLALTSLGTMMAITLSNTLWETVLQERIPQGSLSRVSSYDWMVSLVFQPVAFALVGPLADAIGEAQTLLIASAIVVAGNAGILILVPSVRRMKRLELEDPPLPASEAASIP
ncbi:MAG: MFS transporter [Chloroflexota bacterium]|nr:MFS transporter [Chloroflexota bacterium]